MLVVDALKEFNVLVTRPESQGRTLSQRISDLGANPIAFPTTQIIPIDPVPSFQSEKVYDVMIWVSHNAVTQVPPHLWKNLTISSPCLFVAMGQATAAALYQHGLTATWVAPPGATSEEVITSFSNMPWLDKRVLIIKGKDGRQLLRQGLETLGAVVDELDVYQRVAVAYSNPDAIIQRWDNARYKVSLATSVDIFKNLLTLVGDKRDMVLQNPIICASQRIQSFAVEHHAQKTYLSQGAGDQAIVTSLLELASFC